MEFESYINELEAIVNKLESGEETLENSLELYKKGMEIASCCQGMLKEVKEKISVIENENCKKEK